MRASSREVYCITERYKIRAANDASVRHNLRRADYIGQMSLQFHLLHVNCGVILIQYNIQEKDRWAL